ncbi:MAG: hypothetical protein RI996_235 [Candidatus Parcubacteria bacterium]|jgi:hypothetical protein
MAVVTRLVQKEKVIPAVPAIPRQIIPAVFETVIIVKKEDEKELLKSQYMPIKLWALLLGSPIFLLIFLLAFAVFIPYSLIGSTLISADMFNALLVVYTVCAWSALLLWLGLAYVRAKSRLDIAKNILVMNGWDGEGPTPKWEVEKTEPVIKQEASDPREGWHREGLSPDGFSDLGEGNQL